MGHVPDWARGNMKKTGSAPAKPGTTSRPIFHSEKVAMLADGGTAFDYDNPGKIVGEYQSAEELKGYSGNDPIVQARLGMNDTPAQQPKYDSIEQLLDGKAETPKTVAEALPVEAPRDTTVKAATKASPRPVKARAPKAPAAPAKGMSIMHDESSGDYEHLRNSKASPAKLFYKK